MAADGAPSTDSHKKPDRRWRWLLITAIVIAALVVAAIAGWAIFVRS